MIKPISEKSLTILNYLKSLDADTHVTAQDIANALGMPKKTVDGVITAGLGRKDRKLVERVEAVIEVQNENGETVQKPVKFIKMTDLGQSYDHETVVAEYEAAQAAEKAAKDAE